MDPSNLASLGDLSLNAVIPYLGGDDYFNGSALADRIYGYDGNDQLLGNDVIGDFEDGIDVLRITSGAANFSALTITAQGAAG